MLWFLILAVAIWVFGHVMRVPSFTRWLVICVLYGAVIIALLVFPEKMGLESTFGGGLSEWSLLGGVVLMVLGYRAVLRMLKQRAQPVKATSDEKFSQSELDRYARHIVLREIGGPGQKRLKEARVLVIGAGGLGSPVLLYLAAAGVGTIGIIDDDVVDNSNLQRQVIHRDLDISAPKVQSAMSAMLAQNPNIAVHPFQRRLTKDNAQELFSDYDLILDGTDNIETRYLVNQTCVSLGKPLIAGALSQWEGQLSLYDTANGTPCFACIFPTAPAAGLAPSCAEAGVLGPLPGVVGTMMAVEAIKYVTGAGQGLAGRMQIYDALYGENRTIGLKSNPNCKICSMQSST